MADLQLRSQVSRQWVSAGQVGGGVGGGLGGGVEEGAECGPVGWWDAVGELNDTPTASEALEPDQPRRISSK